jgi:hypothetical protein
MTIDSITTNTFPRSFDANTTNSYHLTQIKPKQQQPSKCNPLRTCPLTPQSAVTPSTPSSSSSATKTTERSPTPRHPSSPALARPTTPAAMAAAAATPPPCRPFHHSSLQRQRCNTLTTCPLVPAPSRATPTTQLSSATTKTKTTTASACSCRYLPTQRHPRAFRPRRARCGSW